MESLHSTRKIFTSCISVIFCLLVSFSSVFLSFEAHAFGGFVSILKNLGKNADVVKTLDHLGPLADQLNLISSKNSESIYAIVENGERLEAQVWSKGEIVERVDIANPSGITRFLNHYRHLQFHIPEKDIIKYQSAFIKVAEKGKIDINLLTDSGSIFPIISRISNNGVGLAVQESNYISYALDAWTKRALLQEYRMADLIERMHIIVMVNKADLKQRTAFVNAFGKRVSLVDSEAALNSELMALDKQFAVLIGHVEETNFLLKGYDGQPLIKIPVKDVHNIIDENNSVALMMGCKIGCKTSLTGAEADIDALNVLTGIKSGVITDTPIQFLEILAKEIGPLHIDKDILGRLRVVADSNAKSEKKLVIGSSMVMSAEVLLPKRMPHVYSPGMTIFLYFFNLLFGWLILWTISKGNGITFVWERYVLVGSRIKYNLSKPKSIYHILIILLCGPYFVSVSLLIAFFIIPFMIIMKIISWISPIPYPSYIFYRLRWLPFYFIYLIVLSVKLTFKKYGDLNEGDTKSDAVV